MRFLFVSIIIYFITQSYNLYFHNFMFLFLFLILYFHNLMLFFYVSTINWKKIAILITEQSRNAWVTSLVLPGPRGNFMTKILDQNGIIQENPKSSKIIQKIIKITQKENILFWCIAGIFIVLRILIRFLYLTTESNYIIIFSYIPSLPPTSLK